MRDDFAGIKRLAVVGSHHNLRKNRGGLHRPMYALNSVNPVATVTLNSRKVNCSEQGSFQGGVPASAELTSPTPPKAVKLLASNEVCGTKWTTASAALMNVSDARKNAEE